VTKLTVVITEEYHCYQPYTKLYPIFLRLTPYRDEIIGDLCGFQSNRANADHKFCIYQTLEKRWEYNGTVHQLLVDFKKVHDSVKREVLYNILTGFGTPMELVRLITQTNP
jgi:hypothetical protein